MRHIFIDQITLHLKAGHGGDGAISFRREKFEPRGGPDGGDGGAGGNILLVVDESLNTLSHLQNRKLYKATSGKRGGGKKSTGKRGEDLRLFVPPGTLVYTEDKMAMVKDLKDIGEEWIAAKGGRGGRGNARFKSSTRQAPRFATEGEEGEERVLKLELRLLADVGLVGLPNSGKSTLLSHISRAKPKIASYPFTTLQPHLGVVRLDDLRTFVVADIPGLIEGAHSGAGLGDEFLRHIERTRLLFHLVDGSGLEGRDPLEDFALILEELSLYHPRLAMREQLVLINKMDLHQARDNYPYLAAEIEKRGYRAFPISAVTGEGMDSLLQFAYQELGRIPPGEVLLEETEESMQGKEPKSISFSIHVQDGVFIITSQELEAKACSLDPSNEEDLQKFAVFLRRAGIEKALWNKGASHGDKVLLGPLEFTFVH